MKELSIEEKARRYDEAIKRVENIKTGKCETTFMFTEGLFEYIFPELKESEDDGIREWLIGYFNQYIIDGMPQVFGNGLNVKDVIAWLKKQGEQKAIEWSGKIGSKSAKGKLKEMLDSKEKTAWSEEDNVFFKAIIRDIENVQYISEDAKKDRINWLKSLKERVQPTNTWKPSDEQIEALDDFIYAKYPNIGKHGAEVKSLYQDLKKLKGE